MDQSSHEWLKLLAPTKSFTSRLQVACFIITHTHMLSSRLRMHMLMFTAFILTCPAGVKHKTSDSSHGAHKRTKLSDLTRGKFVTSSALNEVLTKIKENGLPDAFSRGAQYRDRKLSASYMTPYGKLIHQTTIPGSNLQLAIQNPLAMLYHACEISSYFRE